MESLGAETAGKAIQEGANFFMVYPFMKGMAKEGYAVWSTWDKKGSDLIMDPATGNAISAGEMRFGFLINVASFLPAMGVIKAEGKAAEWSKANKGVAMPLGAYAKEFVKGTGLEAARTLVIAGAGALGEAVGIGAGLPVAAGLGTATYRQHEVTESAGEIAGIKALYESGNGFESFGREALEDGVDSGKFEISPEGKFKPAMGVLDWLLGVSAPEGMRIGDITKKRFDIARKVANMSKAERAWQANPLEGVEGHVKDSSSVGVEPNPGQGDLFVGPFAPAKLTKFEMPKTPTKPAQKESVQLDMFDKFVSTKEPVQQELFDKGSFNDKASPEKTADYAQKVKKEIMRQTAEDANLSMTKLKLLMDGKDVVINGITLKGADLKAWATKEIAKKTVDNWGEKNVDAEKMFEKLESGKFASGNLAALKEAIALEHALRSNDINSPATIKALKTLGYLKETGDSGDGLLNFLRLKVLKADVEGDKSGLDMAKKQLDLIQQKRDAVEGFRHEDNSFFDGGDRNAPISIDPFTTMFRNYRTKIINDAKKKLDGLQENSAPVTLGDLGEPIYDWKTKNEIPAKDIIKVISVEQAKQAKIKA
ncbi:MAG: hypothetical protein HY210_01085 [Candidatus Omnitrophica bacterium]|nr:hypothetical protein [Candidatus Omnitrophota bacterium]